MIHQPLTIGQRVRIVTDVASGHLDTTARVTVFSPPPSWLPDAPPIILVRPDGWKHDLSVTAGEVFPLDGETLS